MKDYRETMRDLSFTREQKDAMVEELMAAAQPAKRQVSHRRVLAIAAAAAMLTLTVTAGATGVLPSARDVFSSLFGGDPAQTEIIDQIGHPIGASHTADGFTITADAIIGDAYNYIVIYSIQREDGTPMPALNYGQEASDPYQSYRLNQDPQYVFFDADPSDPSIQFKYSVSAPKGIKKGPVVVQFQDLVLLTGSNGTEEETLLAAGPWELSYDLDYEDASLSLPEGDIVHHNGADLTLSSVVLSPLSLNVAYSLDFEVDTSIHGDPFDNTEDTPMDRYVDSLPLVLTLTDGTRKELTEESVSTIGSKQGKTNVSKTARFSDILPLDTIESITIGDLTIPVEAP